MSESSLNYISDSDFVTVSYFKSQIQIRFFLSDSDQVSVLDFVSVSDSGAHSDQVSILDFCV